MKLNSETKFFHTLDQLEHHPHVGQMMNYFQHRGNPTFHHCRSVAVSSFRMAQWLGWRVDESALAKGAMLHDFHLYNFKDQPFSFFKHAGLHPQLALKNAEQDFSLSDKERNIILSHMWPVTLFQLPRSKEAFLVTLADKYCALREMCGHRK